MQASVTPPSGSLPPKSPLAHLATGLLKYGLAFGGGALFTSALMGSKPPGSVIVESNQPPLIGGTDLVLPEGKVLPQERTEAPEISFEQASFTTGGALASETPVVLLAPCSNEASQALLDEIKRRFESLSEQECFEVLDNLQNDISKLLLDSQLWSENRLERRDSLVTLAYRYTETEMRELSERIRSQVVPEVSYNEELPKTEKLSAQPTLLRFLNETDADGNDRVGFVYGSSTGYEYIYYATGEDAVRLKHLYDVRFVMMHSASFDERYQGALSRLLTGEDISK